MNLINFHTFEKNRQYVSEKHHQTIGQGLINSHSISICGKENNKYIFTVSYDNVEYKIYIDESNIHEWTIRVKFEEDEESDTINFQAYGNFNNMGKHYIIARDCDDYDHIYIENKCFKIIDIDIEESLPSFDQINLIDPVVITFDDFVNDYIGKRFYFRNECDKQMTKFQVLSHKDTSFTIIVYGEYSCHEIMADIEDTHIECDYNIRVEFKIINEILECTYMDFDPEYCQILSYKIIFNSPNN